MRGTPLRAWMGMNRDTFYDASRVAIIPMGYCYPGRAKGGDMPPRSECAQLWLVQDYAPRYFPMPHPSPRNQPWLERNRGFDRELLPALRARIAMLAP